MSSATLPPKIADDLSQAVALATAYWHAPDGMKLDDEEFARLLDESLSTWQKARQSMVALLLLTHRILDEAGDDAPGLLIRAGLRLAEERAGADE